MTLAELYERVERCCAAEPKTVQQIYVEITNELLATLATPISAMTIDADGRLRDVAEDTPWPNLYDVIAALCQLQGAGRIKAAGNGVTRTYCAINNERQNKLSGR